MRIGFLITARLKSTRLKHKILLDLQGKTVLDRVIDRCRSTAQIDGVVLCTSSHPQDSELYSYAVNNGIEFYIGSEDDVLQRNLDAAVYYGYDAFASVTADNPLFSIEAINAVIRRFRENPFDFGFIQNLPIGCMPYFLRVDALKVACQMKHATETEIWGPFVKRPDYFHIAEFAVTNSIYDESYRLTCDYPEDLELLRTLYRHYDIDAVPPIAAVFRLLQAHPEWWQINASRLQRWPDKSELAEIRRVFDARLTAGRQFAEAHDIQVRPGHTTVPVCIADLPEAQPPEK